MIQCLALYIKNFCMCCSCLMDFPNLFTSLVYCIILFVDFDFLKKLCWVPCFALFIFHLDRILNFYLILDQLLFWFFSFNQVILWLIEFEYGIPLFFGKKYCLWSNDVRKFTITPMVRCSIYDLIVPNLNFSITNETRMKVQRPPMLLIWNRHGIFISFYGHVS